ncbi:hypothetical protein [Flavobacterium sp. GSA192]|uniref:hypothetical protein n=1 Tax=Flavobacterium sp. GSA192 TaxID=2576304 RepID=UPI00112934DE|nr:hypothetical protein [Flavobacterium sp. GSA192]
MKKFDIYKKHKGIYWNKTLIIYCILCICGSSLYLKKSFGFENNFIDDFLFYSIILVLVYGVIIKFYGLVSYEALKGKLEGQLVLEMDRISIENQIYNLDDIQKIEIFNSDYDGQFKYTSRGSFEANLSQGIGNIILIKLTNNEVKDCRFRQVYSDEMYAAKKELVNYHKNGKIHFLHLIDILKITDYDEIQQFKKEI